MDSTGERHHGVKAIQINRARIKERIQEKHRQQSQQVRQGRLSALRDGINNEAASWSATVNNNGGQQLCSSSGPCAPPASSASTLLGYDAAGQLLPVIEDWSDIGNEFGVNILDRDVMECLLAIEDEIRQEQLFLFYDETNGCEWEEYFNSLTS